MRARIGCLGLLAAWTLLGTYIQLTGGFGEDGGGKLAIMGLLGVGAYMLVSIVGDAIDRRSSRTRGFPVHPRLHPRHRRDSGG